MVWWVGTTHVLTLARQGACTRLACGSRPRARTRHAIRTRLMVLRGSSPRAATRASVQVGHDDLTSARMLWRKNRELAPLLAAPAHERHGQKSAWKVCQLADVSGSGQARGESARHRGGSHRPGRAGARQEESMHSRGQGRTGALTEFKDVARLKENVITAENVPEQNVSGQGARESGTSLQTQCGRASQHTRSVDAADSAFNISSMTF